jgi:uncharacterized protein with PhoU and TrkA domain
VGVVFGPGDVLVLQVTEDSPLLKVPPSDFYRRAEESKDGGATSKTSFMNSLTRGLSTRSTIQRPNGTGSEETSEDVEGGLGGGRADVPPEEVAWKDLQVLSFKDGEATGDVGKAREFLAAMQVAPRSSLASKSVTELGLTKLPGVFLVSIDRPVSQHERSDGKKGKVITLSPKKDDGMDERSIAPSLATVDQPFAAITVDTPLEVGDILWFAGSASDLGDLRKIPGLISYESEEVQKINEKVQDRRLVEAVVARRGPLVGKTVKELQFRTKFGAAVIAVHRDGNRIHEHPGKIKLQAGDVLLLEAGPTFIKKSVENTRSFALLAEVEDSAPPRMKLLIPAVIIVIAMLAVATAEVASLLICGLIAAMLMSLMGLISEQEARDAAKWDIFVTIGSAFGIGTALVNSGLASAIAGVLVDLGEAIGIGGKSLGRSQARKDIALNVLCSC